jgi:4,4'-diaponeurosporenoate glycosyltransferase
MTELFWSALLNALYVLQIHWMLLRIGNFGFLPALLFQVPLVFFVFLFGLSLFRIFFLRMVPWKGRNVNTRKEKS